MAKRRQSKAELEIQYREQWTFLRTSCAAYDAGRTIEAKRIALVLRVLLHDTRTSRSLLGQLGRKDILFFDIAEDIRPDNQLPTFALVVVKN